MCRDNPDCPDCGIPTKFREGDRVVRPYDVYDDHSRLMHGTVIRVYSDLTSRFGPYPELYEVKWDHDEQYRAGYLPHGISKQ